MSLHQNGSSVVVECLRIE